MLNTLKCTLMFSFFCYEHHSKQNYQLHRLQNSPYFCVFKYARAIKQRSGTRLKTGSETGERWALNTLQCTLMFSFFSYEHHSKQTWGIRSICYKCTPCKLLTSDKKTMHMLNTLQCIMHINVSTKWYFCFVTETLPGLVRISKTKLSVEKYETTTTTKAVV